MNSADTSIFKSPWLVYPLVIILALLVGFASFDYLAKPKVAVIKLAGTIDSETTDDITEMLRFAKERRDVRAVVLKINSPGGSASLSEDIYLSVLALKDEKPVVASVDQIGLSGGYFAAIGANMIYAKPTSLVGSVGVVTRLPSPDIPDEDTVTSGPLKEQGVTRRDWAYQAKEAFQTFLSSVIKERGSKLSISREDLSSGGIYIGVEGLRSGLVDRLGSTEDAIQAAASLAGVRRYSVLDVNEELGVAEPTAIFQVNQSDLEPSNTAPVHYYLYVEME